VLYQDATGNWIIMLSASDYAISSIAGFGGAGYTPVP